MAAQEADKPQQSNSPEPGRAADGDKGDRGMLIVDGLGRIHGCGAAIENLFGTSHGQLIGQPVSAFIAGLLFEGNSPAETARQLAHLCAQNQWRIFNAIDAQGAAFPVEIHVSRRMTEKQAVFVFNMRRP